jgi:hypothetical protein
MHEFKAQAYSGGGAAGGSVRRNDPQRPEIKTNDLNDTAPQWDIVRLDAEEFADFEKCMLTPQTPSPSILKAAELLRTLPPQKN